MQVLPADSPRFPTELMDNIRGECFATARITCMFPLSVKTTLL